MTKRKYALSIFFFTVSFVAPGCAFGAVTITEVMYNPLGSDTGREWIELYNSGAEVVELEAGQKGWRIHDGANHVFGSSVVVPAGGFVIVANNPTTVAGQYPGGFLIVKSALSLNNTSDALSLLDADGKIVDTVSYTKSLGGFEDGMSLHRVGSTFAPGVPNPGAPPMPGVPKKAPAPAKAVAPQKPLTQKTTELPKSIEPEVSNTATSSVAAVGAMPAQGGFLWHYILGLAALILFGVASVWHIRSEQEKRPETPSLADEFDIE